MSLLDPGGTDKVVPLPSMSTQTEGSALVAAAQIRRHLSLLQGYADLMEGLSPAQAVQVLRVMADKVERLSETLRPFLDRG